MAATATPPAVVLALHDFDTARLYNAWLLSAHPKRRCVGALQSGTTTTAPAVVGGANDSTPGAPVVVSGAPAPAKKISFTRFTLVPGPTSPTSLRPSPSSYTSPSRSSYPSLPAPRHPVHHHHAAATHSPLYTHHASFQDLTRSLTCQAQALSSLPSQPLCLLALPSTSSFFLLLLLYSDQDDSDEDDSDENDSDDDDARGGYAHTMGPCLVGSFRPPPPNQRYHGHSRSRFGLTKGVWSMRLALCEGPSLLPRRRFEGNGRYDDALLYPLTSHPSFFRLRCARPALLEEEDHRPSEPPVTSYPRMGDLRSLHAEKDGKKDGKGEAWCVKVDKGFGGVGVWTLRKIVWIREVQEVQMRLQAQEAKGRELEERSSASERETEDEDEHEETLVDSDSEWDSVSTTCSSRQEEGEASDAQLSTEKGNLIEMAVGRVNSAGKGDDGGSGGGDVDVETSHMASSAWLCAFYRASLAAPSSAQRRGQGQRQGQVQVRGHSQMQWQGRWTILLEIARRDGVRIKVVKPASSSVGDEGEGGEGCEVVEAFGEV
ncbi:hypothetical protein DFP72DRAFT_1169583 [Ephemerocybe angulata]|uniref:Uncharacterized protein n=1 Tax=Ephemerocybe angulata TaxID=980116 RepID=A0A8H6M7V1_9AGAR|nr:hypothetical protein DFP72DRAFT_1169583 [Tulosesus angulatus]